jgi:hypothetical protein
MPWINGRWVEEEQDWLNNMGIWDRLLDQKTIYDKGPGTTLIPSNFPSPRNTLPGILEGGDGVTPGYNPTLDASRINESITTQAQAPASAPMTLFSMPAPPPRQQVRYMAPRTPMTPISMASTTATPARVRTPTPTAYIDPTPTPAPDYIDPTPIPTPPRDISGIQRARDLARQQAANQRATDLASQRQAAANQRAIDLASQRQAAANQRAQAASQAQAARAQAQARAVIANAAGRDRGGPSSRELAAAREVLSQVDTFGGGRLTGDSRNGGAAAGALGGYRGDPGGREAAIGSRGGSRNGGGRGGPGGRGR